MKKLLPLLLSLFLLLVVGCKNEYGVKKGDRIIYGHAEKVMFTRGEGDELIWFVKDLGDKVRMRVRLPKKTEYSRGEFVDEDIPKRRIIYIEKSLDPYPMPPLTEFTTETKFAEEVPVNPIKYEIKGDAATITGCDKSASGKLVIPVTIEGKSVTRIGVEAFENCIHLTSITIPNAVTSIGKGAFFKCRNLTSVTIPDSVTNIGESAFAYCTRLTSIAIPDSVQLLHQRTFELCENLTAVTFLGDAPKDGRDVFKGATPTIYRKPEAKGWGDTWAGRPVKLIGEKP